MAYIYEKTDYTYLVSIFCDFVLGRKHMVTIKNKVVIKPHVTCRYN